MVKSQLEFITSRSNLIEAITRVQFGELYGVEIAARSELHVHRVELSPAMQRSDLYIRGGCQYIDILTVHNGQPTLAETDSTSTGFRCRKKVKFPTGSKRLRNLKGAHSRPDTRRAEISERNLSPLFYFPAQ